MYSLTTAVERKAILQNGRLQVDPAPPFFPTGLADKDTLMERKANNRLIDEVVEAHDTFATYLPQLLNEDGQSHDEAPEADHVLVLEQPIHFREADGLCDADVVRVKEGRGFRGEVRLNTTQPTSADGVTTQARHCFDAEGGWWTETKTGAYPNLVTWATYDASKGTLLIEQGPPLPEI